MDNKEDFARGAISFSLSEIKEANIFSVFKLHLRTYTNVQTAGWYAYKKDNDTIRFLWAENMSIISKNELVTLEKEGYTIHKNYVEE